MCTASQVIVSASSPIMVPEAESVIPSPEDVPVPERAK